MVHPLVRTVLFFQEFAENLRESGVHGALMVLEPTFTADTLATALGIPPSKCYIRRHLTTELESLVKPARYVGIFSILTLLHSEG